MSYLSPQEAFVQWDWLNTIALPDLCNQVDFFLPADFSIEQLLRRRPLKLPLKNDNLPPSDFPTVEFKERIYIFDRDGDRMGMTGKIILSQQWRGQILERLINLLKAPCGYAEVNETIEESLIRQHLPINSIGYIVIIRPVTTNRYNDLIDHIWVYRLFSENSEQFDEAPVPRGSMVLV